ncbi:MAG: D-alanine--D-alanine ligase [Oligoflexia bacterium]|nr:D-alanine--D-alanine ligase [Oligoflexia bacterium]
MKKKAESVCVICGGRSPEHRVSLVSANNVVNVLKNAGYRISVIGIENESGKWRYYDNADFFSRSGDLNSACLKETGWKEIYIKPGNGGTLYYEDRGGAKVVVYDVVFPVIHGANCEDGKLQGLLEHLDIGLVGCKTLASAVGMDKVITKILAAYNSIPVVPWITCEANNPPDKEEVRERLGYPVFVKPADSGSAIGVTKVYREEDLDPAVKNARGYSKAILIERGINAREIEFSVLGKWDGKVEVSLPGEIVPLKDFYSYDAKYIDDKGAELIAPAKISPVLIEELSGYAETIFRQLRCSGLSRIDFFLDKKTDDVYFNEINTIPGFTAISMYPRLWEVSGIDSEMLLKRLIAIAMEY